MDVQIPAANPPPPGHCAGCRFAHLGEPDPNNGFQRMRTCRWGPPHFSLVQMGRGHVPAAGFPLVRDDQYCFQFQSTTETPPVSASRILS